MRLRYFITAFGLIALLSGAPAFAANDSSGDNGVAHAGGLSCFSIAPLKGGRASCDALCGTKGAVCVSLKMREAVNPGLGCGDALDPLKGGDSVTGCRCYAAGH